MTEEVKRNYLEINSLQDLIEGNKPSEDYSLSLINPINFQLNKFFYKNIGKKHKWVDRLTWSEEKWINYVSSENVNGKIENGNCTIEYPKKIFCEYAKSNNKILVSNGKSLVIKTKTSYYRYPLEKTALNLILDKKFLLDKLDQVERIKENDETFSFKIVHNNNLLNIYFDKISYEIKGWTTTDIYLNRVETKLSNVETNIMIDERIFRVQNYIN